MSQQPPRPPQQPRWQPQQPRQTPLWQQMSTRYQQPFPPPQPPLPLHQRLLRWYRRQKRNAKLVPGCGMLIFVLLLCGYIASAGSRITNKNVPTQETLAPSPIGTESLVVKATREPTHQQQQRHSQAAENTFYVAPNGSDSNDGSQTHPFATIQKAADRATAGTTIHVASGTYTQTVTNNHSGTTTAPITFISDTKWGAKISTGGGLRNFPFRNNGSYVHIIGFDITSTTAWSGILTYGQHNLIQGNHVHNFTGMACNGSPGGQGIGDDASASNNSFIGNLVNNIGNYPTRCDYVHGIYLDGVGDLVQNNISYNNAGTGIITNHESGPIIITNNLSFANADYGIAINGTHPVDGFFIGNNIVMDNGLAGIDGHHNANGVHNQFINNIMFNNHGSSLFYVNGSPGTPKGTITGTITSDPQLVNYKPDGTGDYHLKSTSPAIDAGVSTNAPSTDYDGNARPQGKGYDIGPYEFGSNGTGTSTPTSKLSQWALVDAIWGMVWPCSPTPDSWWNL